MKFQIIHTLLLINGFCFVSCDRAEMHDKNHETEQSQPGVDPDELYGEASRDFMRDPNGSFEKLVLAAARGHFLAAQEVAMAYWPEGFDFQKYGKDVVDAKINILNKAISENNLIYLNKRIETDLILASLYNKDASVAYDPAKARSIYRSLSEDMDVEAWSYYAKMSFDGIGGEKDLREAYFYYSAMCFAYDFDSTGAKNAWEMRNEIVQKIDAHDALSELARLEKWFAENRIPSAKYTKYAQGDSGTENAVKIRKEREEAHVKALQKMVKDK